MVTGTTILRYDGSWDGFLSAVFDMYEYKFTDPVLVPDHALQTFALGAEHRVHTHAERAGRVFAGLEKWLKADELKSLFYIYLSEHPQREDVLWHLVKMAFAEHRFVLNHYQHPLMQLGTKLVKQLGREKHRMEAFVRFKQLEDGLFFAIIEPDFDVLPVIKKHFQDRYQNQRWVIYDTRRNYGLYYDMNEVEEVQLQENPKQKLLNNEGVHASEQWYEGAWLTYFTHVNIKARKNTKLHVQHMPKRYWKFLTEKQSWQARLQ